MILSLSWNCFADDQMWQQTSVHVAVSRGNSKLLKTLLFVANVDVNARMVRLVATFQLFLLL